MLLIGRATDADFKTDQRHSKLAVIAEMIHTASLIHEDVLEEHETDTSQGTLVHQEVALDVGNKVYGRMYHTTTQIPSRPHPHPPTPPVLTLSSAPSSTPSSPLHPSLIPHLSCSSPCYPRASPTLAHACI